MHSRSLLVCRPALLLAACVLVGCAGASRLVQHAGVEDDVAELVFRRVLARPELVPERMLQRVTLCLMRGPRHAAGPVPPQLLQRFEKDARFFTTARTLDECWAYTRRAPGEEQALIAPLFLETVRWEGGDEATAAVSFECGPHGCARGQFSLMRDSAGWSVVSERYCDEDAGSAHASGLEVCSGS